MRMNGCNADFENKNGNPGTANKSRMVPSQFARNNLSMGGVNKHQGGTTENKKPPVSAGGAGKGK